MLPVSLAAAGAVAGAAYLNARFSLGEDLRWLRITGSTMYKLSRATRTDKINAFYVLEGHALEKKSADRAFIIFGGKSYSYAET